MHGRMEEGMDGGGEGRREGRGEMKLAPVLGARGRKRTGRQGQGQAVLETARDDERQGEARMPVDAGRGCETMRDASDDERQGEARMAVKERRGGETRT